jgi:two-component system, NarL family, nitrate/nitrite response regulator NarL
MRPQISEATRKPLPVSRPNSAASPEDLLRLLVNQLPSAVSGDKQPSCNPAHDPDEIVFDTEIDGFHYFLVRTPKSTHAPIALSPREKEIVRMVAQGHPNKIIAGVLNISSWTVCTHLRRVFAKLGVGSRAAMVARLLEIGAVRSAPHTSHAAEEAVERRSQPAQSSSPSPARASEVSRNGSQQPSVPRRTA